MAEQTRRELDAIDLLLQDHREVESLFSEFAYLSKIGEDASEVIASACAELRIHDALENDVFYPAVSDAANEREIKAFLDEAEDAHDSVLDLIEELEQSAEGASARDAQFTIIAEQVKQHIEREESELFPKVTKLRQVDLYAVASDMKARRKELMGEAENVEVS